MIPGTVLLGVCVTRDAQYTLGLAPLTLLETRVRPRLTLKTERRPIAVLRPFTGITRTVI